MSLSKIEEGMDNMDKEQTPAKMFKFVLGDLVTLPSDLFDSRFDLDLGYFDPWPHFYRMLKNAIFIFDFELWPMTLNFKTIRSQSVEVGMEF